MSDRRTYFAKVENGIVTDVRIVDWEFLVANPERYGDSSSWVECDINGRHTVWGIGTTYDAVNDVFIAPAVEEL